MTFAEVLGVRRVIAVVRHDDPRIAATMALTLIDAGVDCIEMTFTVPGAARLIGELVAGRPHAVVGGGTILTADDALAAAGAGARFLVSPAYGERAHAAAESAGLAYVPGVMTPSEVLRAGEVGLRELKLFPASTVGVQHLQNLRSVFPGARFMPTGGIDESNAAQWFDAGATAVGVGGALNAAWRQGGSRQLAALAGRLAAL